MKMKLNKLLEWLGEDMWWHIEYYAYDVPRSWYYEAKMAYQRVLRGYDNRFVYGMNHEHSVIMIGALTQLRNYKNSYPVKFDTLVEWTDILDKMIEGFEASRRMNYYIKTKEYKRLKKVQDEGLGLFMKYYQELWD